MKQKNSYYLSMAILIGILCCCSASVIAVEFDDPYSIEIGNFVCDKLVEATRRATISGAVHNYHDRKPETYVVRNFSCELAEWDDAWFKVKFSSESFIDVYDVSDHKRYIIEFSNSAGLMCFFSGTEYEWVCGFSSNDFSAIKYEDVPGGRNRNTESHRIKPYFFYSSYYDFIRKELELNF